MQDVHFRNLNNLQRCNRRILQLKPTELSLYRECIERKKIPGLLSFIIFSKPFLNGTRRERRNIDHRTRKLTMLKTIHQSDDIALFQEKNEDVLIRLRIVLVQQFRDSQNLQTRVNRNVLQQLNQKWHNEKLENINYQIEKIKTGFKKKTQENH